MTQMDFYLWNRNRLTKNILVLAKAGEVGKGQIGTSEVSDADETYV